MSYYVSFYFQQLLYQLFTSISNGGPLLKYAVNIKREQPIKVLDHLKDDYYSPITKQENLSLSQ